ncbi:magnesium transporter CorA family protein [Periweissella cryptocerci]|uniref:Magnesium transporter CorA family protein n=1 Tax=Periweissella cryptocerci TaxID=2506420 RepID=A0A4V1AIR4_9LACO|nr:magnesium transporter CorA family protein [Periweissella cryptocerci]QBO36415.1 magnesium transporter CorA family protein [Periweissella cryptocerci]
MLKQHQPFPKFEWFQVFDVTPSERQTLIDKYGLTDELIFYATDPNESARMEYDKARDIMLMIFDIVTPDSERAATEPMGILFKDHRLFTFTRSTTTFADHILEEPNNNQVQVDHDQIEPLDIVLNGLYSLATDYVGAIVGINRRRKGIQDRLTQSKSIQKEINSLLDLETSLIYFLNSLRSDKVLLLELKRHEANNLTLLQSEHIDDILVEVSQGIDMAEMAQEVINSVSSAYSNLVNSDLNWTMKLLTVYSIVLTVPTIVSGFYGENVELPFMHADNGWIYTIGITVLGMALAFIILWRAGFFKK